MVIPSAWEGEHPPPSIASKMHHLLRCNPGIIVAAYLVGGGTAPGPQSNDTKETDAMFFHDKRLQYYTKPEKSDPLLARRVQELLGGQFGEMSVMMQYLFQGWGCRGPAKYRDMLLDIGTEEIAHVEMLATMISHLLEKAPIEEQEAAASHPVIGAIMGGGDATEAVMAGMDPQHLICAGLGASLNDSNGFPWTGRYIVASGNLMADFRANLNAESQGRLQVCRVYQTTDDRGVRDTFDFMLARDTMHQNQWIAAIADLQASGLEDVVTPMTFPYEKQKLEYAYQLWDLSKPGEESAQGMWAQGQTPDGKGTFEHLENPQPLGPAAKLGQISPLAYGTLAEPVPAMST
jgi:Mn-containing catalase